MSGEPSRFLIVARSERLGRLVVELLAIAHRIGRLRAVYVNGSIRVVRHYGCRSRYRIAVIVTVVVAIVRITIAVAITTGVPERRKHKRIEPTVVVTPIIIMAPVVVPVVIPAV